MPTSAAPANPPDPVAPAAPPAAPPAGSPAGSPTDHATDHAAQAWALGALRLETDAVGAQVWIDEQPVGRAPLPGAWALSAGAHQVRLELGEWRGSAQALVSVGAVTTLRLYRVDPSASAPAADAALARASAVGAQLERVHPGAGIPVRGVGYVLLALGVGALGYGVYAHLEADVERQRALLVRSPAGEASLAGAMGELWAARLAIGGGLVGALSGVGMLGWSRGGWFLEDSFRGEAP